MSTPPPELAPWTVVSVAPNMRMLHGMCEGSPVLCRFSHFQPGGGESWEAVGDMGTYVVYNHKRTGGIRPVTPNHPLARING